MMKLILVIEDEPDIQLTLQDEFESLGFKVITASQGEDGYVKAVEEKPDIIILDIMLPGMNGYEICRKIRSNRIMTPIIMLTVKDTEIDKVMGLEIGADDYVTKPFSLRELVARVNAIFRRQECLKTAPVQYSMGKVELDFNKYECHKEGREIHLTPVEYQMLKLLILHRGQVLSRNEILDYIWGMDNLTVTTRTVDSHIANLRKKIEDYPSKPKFILSVHGIGYKLAE